MKSPFLLIALNLFILHSSAQSFEVLENKIDDIVLPLVKTNNYSGSVLISKNNQIQFSKSYGKMSREFDLVNNKQTKFLLASVSMIFTSAAIMKLHENGILNINDPLGYYIPDYKYGNEITISQLLSQRSGIPAIGYLDNLEYDSITKFSHDAKSLYSYFKDYELLFEPGAQYNHGRSDYILLALIIERLSGKSFGEYMKEEIFQPLGMNNSGHYTSQKEIISNLAKGYAPKDLFDVESAEQLDWSSKTGHASIYSTTEDLNKFANAIHSKDFLSEFSWNTIFTDYGNQVGYGWFIRDHLNRKRLQMNGRSPGFSSYIAIYPEDSLSIIVLSNNYISLSADLGMMIAASVLDQPFEKLNLVNQKIDENAAAKFIGTYKFKDDFYVPNFELEVKNEDGNLITQWGGLIPIKKDNTNITTFILRTYWSSLEFVTDENGQLSKLKFDNYLGVKLD